MVSTFTPNTNIELQGTGDNSGTWGVVLNTNALTVIDSVFGGVQTLSLSSTNVTVSTPQSQNNCIILTGVLTADVQVIFPSIGRTYFIVNNTTGAHTVTLKTASAGVTQVIPQGKSAVYVLTGTDVLTGNLPDNATDIAAGVLKAQSQEAGYNAQTASYTLVLTDRGKLVSINNAGATNLTVPPNSSVAFPAGAANPTRIDLTSMGVGQVTIVPGLGVTIHSADTKLKLAKQYSGASLVQIAVDEWIIFGDLVA